MIPKETLYEKEKRERQERTTNVLKVTKQSFKQHEESIPARKSLPAEEKQRILSRERDQSNKLANGMPVNARIRVVLCPECYKEHIAEWDQYAGAHREKDGYDIGLFTCCECGVAYRGEHYVPT